MAEMESFKCFILLTFRYVAFPRENKVQPKLIFHLFMTHHFLDVDYGDIFQST